MMNNSVEMKKKNIAALYLSSGKRENLTKLKNKYHPRVKHSFDMKGA